MLLVHTACRRFNRIKFCRSKSLMNTPNTTDILIRQRNIIILTAFCATYSKFIIKIKTYKTYNKLFFFIIILYFYSILWKFHSFWKNEWIIFTKYYGLYSHSLHRHCMSGGSCCCMFTSSNLLSFDFGIVF